MKPPSPFTLPPNLPVMDITDEEVGGSGWRRVAVGELVKTHYQCFILIPSPHWKMSAYYTSDAYHANGRSNYRAPASLRAWLTVLPGIVGKSWRRLWEKKRSQS